MDSHSPQNYKVDQVIEILAPQDMSELLDRILDNLAAMTKTPGGESCIVEHLDIYACYASSPQQMAFYLEALRESGWLRKIADGWSSMMITVSGWKRISELHRVGVKTRQAFVAMSFDSSLEAAWRDGLFEAIAATGHRPIRVDKEEHNEKICDRLITEIRRSRFVVADVTRHRQGVYFEAGYAMGLGIPVIWTCRKDHMKKCHLDTRQYNHIVWETPAELAKALELRILATIGEPPR